jgi:hypothetical protein
MGFSVRAVVVHLAAVMLQGHDVVCAYDHYLNLF